MSEEIQADAGVTAEAAIDAYSAGQILAAAREHQKLSIPDVARNLKIAVRQVEALEADAYDKLPGMTFVKGFVRNYAKLLQLDPEPLLATLQDSLPQEPTQAISSHNEGIELSSGAPKRWLWAVVVILAVVIAIPLLVYELLHTDVNPLPQAFKANAPSAVAPVVPKRQEKPAVPLQVPRQPVPEAPISPLPPALQQEQAGVGSPSLAPAQPQPAGAATVAEGRGAIKMAFSQDAWVEIRDKDKKIIFSRLNPGGTEQIVRGDPPFSIVIGNAANVRITYNEKPVDLAPYIRVNVARLTLE